MIVSPKQILWPTDFSTLSLKGAQYARGFCEVFGARLHVLHVVGLPAAGDPSLVLPVEPPVSYNDDQVIAACRSGVDRIVSEQFDAAQDVVREVLVGSAWGGVCDYAKRHDIDLIILATHGRSGLRHALIGSTAERIVRHAPCPVLVVKNEERDFLVE